jgi:hypothetical protein
MDHPERRRSLRAKVARPLRVRPSEPRDEHFDEVVSSVNASREGIYFLTRRENYYAGMHLFVTVPYTSRDDPMNCEYVGQVVRVEKLTSGKFGIAVHLGVTLNYGASSSASARIRA